MEKFKINYLRDQVVLIITLISFTVLVLLFLISRITLAANGEVLSSNKISDGVGDLSTLPSNNDAFGYSVDDAGDFDGDGITDIIVGLRDNDTGGSNRGAVSLIMLGADGAADADYFIADGTGGFSETLGNADYFGERVTKIGDLDNDGVIDYAVSATGDDDGGDNRGAVYVLFMNSNGTVSSSQKISDTAGDFTATLDNADVFGSGLEGIGDFDGDGIEDLLVGASGDDDGGSNRGAVYILYLGTDGSVDGYDKISNATTNFTTYLDNNDEFGIDVADIGDFDGDGVTDILVGALKDDDGGSNRGAAYLLLLDSSGGVKSSGVKKISDTTGSFSATFSNNDYFGSAVTSIGDMDNDGVTDFAIGAYGEDTAGSASGTVYVLFMNSDGTASSYVLITEGNGGLSGSGIAANEDFGTSVSGLTDLDGDGINDMVSGAPDDGAVGTKPGAIHIMFMDGVAPPDNVSQNIDLKDTDTDGVPDQIQFEIENIGGDTWSLSGASPHGLSVTQGGNIIDISSVAISGSASASPVIIQVNLDESDSDMVSDTDGVDANAIELIYTQQTGDQTCTVCIEDSNEEMNTIATGDSGTTDTEEDIMQPVILSVSPAEDATQVSDSYNVSITFSEGMDTNFNLGNEYSISPTPAWATTEWTEGDSVITWTHAGFSHCVTETLTTTEANIDANSGTNTTLLTTGPEDGDWSFTTQCDRGVSNDIRLLDADTDGIIDRIQVEVSNESVATWALSGASPYGFSVTQGGNAIDISSVAISGSATANPVTFLVNLDETDADMVTSTDGVNENAFELIYTQESGDQTCSTACVEDQAAVEMNAIATGDASGTVNTEVDYAQPVILSISPDDLATSVDANSSIVLTFSEAMDTGFVEGTEYSITPDPTSPSAVWSVSDSVVTLSDALASCSSTTVATDEGEIVAASGSATGLLTTGPEDGDWGFSTGGCGGSGALPSPSAIDIGYTGAICEENPHTFGFQISGDDISEFIISDNEFLIGSDWQDYKELVQYTHNDSPSPTYILFRSKGKNLSIIYKITTEDWYDVCGQNEDIDDTGIGDDASDMNDDESEVETPATDGEGKDEDIIALMGEFVYSLNTESVHYIDYNGHSHLVTQLQIYKTWKKSFADMKIVGREIMEKIPQSSLLLPKGGTVLVKHADDDKVYYAAVNPIDETRPRILYVENEAVAELLFTKDWNQYIIDLPEQYINLCSNDNESLVNGWQIEVNIDKMLTRRYLNNETMKLKTIVGKVVKQRIKD